MARKADEFAPCRLVEHEGGRFSLVFDDFGPTAETFEELDQDGGGYGWHGVVDALVRMKAPKLKRRLEYDPESSMFAVVSTDRDALRQVADLIRAAVQDSELLKEAIRKADPELMD